MEATFPRETAFYAALGPMGPTLRISHFGLLLVSLFQRCESVLVYSGGSKKHLGLRNDCSGKEGWCQGACPKDWMYYKFNCYRIFMEPLTWTAAEVACQGKKMNAHLATFFNRQELTQMTKYLSSTHEKGERVWIGLYDPRHTGIWRWVDLSLTFYLPWDIGEPNHPSGDEHCVHLTAETGFSKLNDAPCNLEMAYFCKFPL